MSPHVYFGASRLNLGDYVRCAVEAELVFHIGRDIEAGFTRSDMASAIQYVSPGIEVHNYKFWYGKPTAQELIASNAIHACLVVGRERTRPDDLDFQKEQVELFVDGQLADSTTSAETMGGPLTSLAWLAERLTARGSCLRAGDLVIPGSPGKLVAVPKGAVVRGQFSRCGTVQVEFA